MAITQASVLPQQYVSQLGQDYGQQLAGLTSIPLDTSQFAPTVAAQDPLQTQAASLAASGVGGYQPYLGQAATQGTQAISTLGGVSPYISAAGQLTGTGAGTGAGSIASYISRTNCFFCGKFFYFFYCLFCFSLFSKLFCSNYSCCSTIYKCVIFFLWKF